MTLLGGGGGFRAAVPGSSCQYRPKRQPPLLLTQHRNDARRSDASGCLRGAGCPPRIGWDSAAVTSNRHKVPNRLKRMGEQVMHEADAHPYEENSAEPHYWLTSGPGALPVSSARYPVPTG